MNEPAPEKPYKLPTGIACPRCKEVFAEAQDVTPGASNQFKKGKIIVCSKCALISIVGDSSLIPMSVAQVKALPQVMQAQLMVICQTLAANATKDN